MTTYQKTLPEMQSFSKAWRSIACSRFWPFAMLAIGTASNLVYAHTPLVAFAAMAGMTLPRRKAIAIALMIWFVNQVIGFTLRGYPQTSVAFTWGVLMGIGTLLTVAWASWRPAFSQYQWVGHLLWMAIALLGGFILYQGLIVLASPVLADGHWMGWNVVVRLFIKQLMWAGAIALCHSLWLKVTIRRALSSPSLPSP